MEAPPRALLLVRNTVRHDARVLRAARTLRGAGFDPLVVGVMSDTERERSSLMAGVDVLRLDPRPLLVGTAMRLLRRGRDDPAAPAPASAPSPAEASASPAATPRVSLPVRIVRLLRTIDFYRRGVRVALATRPALIHANDHNTMWIGLVAKALTGCRLVYDAHELWPDRNGRWEWRPLLVAEEALFVRAADAVIAASPGYADAMARRYRVARPAVVRNIPHTAERSSSPVAVEPDLVLYVGGLLRGRGLEQAIDAMALLDGVRLRLLGPGAPAYVEALRQRAEAAGVAGRVEIVPPVPPGDVVSALRSAAVGLSLIQPVSLSYELTMPNKVFEYLAAGVPVLVSDLPVMAQFVRRHDVGAVAPPDDVGAIARAIEGLLEPDRQTDVRAAVRRAAQTLTWENESRTLVAAYRGAEPAQRAAATGPKRSL